MARYWEHMPVLHQNYIELVIKVSFVCPKSTCYSTLELQLLKKKTGNFIFSEPPASLANQFAWHPSGEINMTMGGQGSVAINTHKQENEDVEVMSTDSSSSSSSDSQ